MKKWLLAFLTTACFLSCTPLDRKNPTDPAASNYEGMHYIGSIGDFSGLGDFMVMGGYIWCVETSTDRIYKYNLSGDSGSYFINLNVHSPTGICNDGILFYVADSDAVVNNLKRFDPADMSNTQARLPFYQSLAFIKCAASPSYLFAATATEVYRFDTAGNTMSVGVVYGDNLPGEALSTVSDIEYNAATGEVIVADSGADRLIILSPDLTFIRDMVFTYDITGFAVKGNIVYVPASDGIKKYYYDSGVVAGDFANYGEGYGMITAAGPCAVYGDYVLVGTGTAIKVFGP